MVWKGTDSSRHTANKQKNSSQKLCNWITYYRNKVPNVIGKIQNSIYITYEF